jgi:ABC-type protease/lipase transport system fused ATPase/permease subunit
MFFRVVVAAAAASMLLLLVCAVVNADTTDDATANAATTANASVSLYESRNENHSIIFGLRMEGTAPISIRKIRASPTVGCETRSFQFCWNFPGTYGELSRKFRGTYQP